MGELSVIVETGPDPEIDGIVRFADHLVGLIDRRTRKLRPFPPPRPGKRKARNEQNRKTVNDVSGQ